MQIVLVVWRSQLQSFGNCFVKNHPNHPPTTNPPTQPPTRPKPPKPTANTHKHTHTQWFLDRSAAVFSYCEIPGLQSLCSSKQVALRFSFANFSFFAAHVVLLFWCTKESDFRAGVHTGLWFWKVLIWAGAIVGFFFVPSNAMAIYAQIARVGAGLFLVFVMVEMVSWVYDINEWLVKRDNKLAWAALIAGAGAGFLGGLALIGASYHFYAPTPKCHLNLFLITWSIVVGFALVGVLFVPRRLEVAGLMTSGAVFLYCSYLLYSALGRIPTGECMRVAVGDQWVQVRGCLGLCWVAGGFCCGGGVRSDGSMSDVTPNPTHPIQPQPNPLNPTLSTRSTPPNATDCRVLPGHRRRLLLHHVTRHQLHLQPIRRR